MDQMLKKVQTLSFQNFITKINQIFCKIQDHMLTTKTNMQVNSGWIFPSTLKTKRTFYHPSEYSSRLS